MKRSDIVNNIRELLLIVEDERTPRSLKSVLIERIEIMLLVLKEAE